MKAMIFAAGIGSRLKPLTDTKPKALIEVNGVTLLEHAVRRLQKFGINEIIINVHHFHRQVKGFLKKNKNFGADIKISDESGKLRDTGGGLKKASWFFNDGNPFLAYNVDVISDIDLSKMLEAHVKSFAVATIAVMKRETSRYFLFNNEMKLCGWINEQTGRTKISRESEKELEKYAFSGIQILNPKIFNMFSSQDCFSMTDLYLRISTYHKVCGYRHDNDFWLDLGKPELTEGAEIFLKNNPSYHG